MGLIVQMVMASGWNIDYARNNSQLIPGYQSVDRKLWVKYSVKDEWEVFCHHDQMISSAIEQSPLLQISTSDEVVLSGSFLTSLLMVMHVPVCIHTYVCVAQTYVLIPTVI